MEVTSRLFRLHLICGGAVAWARPSGFRDVSGAGRGFSLTFLGNIPSITPFADRCSMAAARVRCDLREWPSSPRSIDANIAPISFWVYFDELTVWANQDLEASAAYWWPNDAADSKTLEGHSPQPRDPARAPCRARLSTPRHAPASGPRLPRRGPASPPWGTARPRPSPGRAWDCSPHPAGSCAVL